MSCWVVGTQKPFPFPLDFWYPFDYISLFLHGSFGTNKTLRIGPCSLRSLAVHTIIHHSGTLSLEAILFAPTNRRGLSSQIVFKVKVLEWTWWLCQLAETELILLDQLRSALNSPTSSTAMDQDKAIMSNGSEASLPTSRNRGDTPFMCFFHLPGERSYAKAFKNCSCFFQFISIW